jgi:hypothetical protein
MNTNEPYSNSMKAIGSFHFVLVLFVLLLLSYAFLMPAFEGADEPEHLRFIEAVFDGEDIHPIHRDNPRRYGIEVYQPPLYYYIAAFAAKLFPVAFPKHLAINPEKNPNRPFLVHDIPGEVFPFDPPRKTLRFFRILSALFGIVGFVILAQILHVSMPRNPQGTNIVLLVAALWPNNLQMSSLVSNLHPYRKKRPSILEAGLNPRDNSGFGHIEQDDYTGYGSCALSGYYH